MNDIVDPLHQTDARAFRALTANYRGKPRSVPMGADRAGA